MKNVLWSVALDFYGSVSKIIFRALSLLYVIFSFVFCHGKVTITCYNKNKYKRIFYFRIVSGAFAIL